MHSFAHVSLFDVRRTRPLMRATVLSHGVVFSQSQPADEIMQRMWSTCLYLAFSPCLSLSLDLSFWFPLRFSPSLPLSLCSSLPRSGSRSLSFWFCLCYVLFFSLSLSPSIRLAPSPASLTPLHDFEHVAISVSALSRRQDMFVGRVRMLTNF